MASQAGLVVRGADVRVFRSNGGWVYFAVTRDGRTLGLPWFQAVSSADDAITRACDVLAFDDAEYSRANNLRGGV